LMRAGRAATEDQRRANDSALRHQLQRLNGGIDECR
jgi:hypothetical protein